MNESAPRLTQGPVGGHLVGMTAPVLIGIFTMMLQTFVDAWFIGKVGDQELAALAFAFPVIMVITSLAIGLGAGTSSVVARAFGSGNHRRARRLSTDSLILSFVVTTVIAVVGWMTINPLFRLLGVPVEMMSLVEGYMRILYVGVPFVVVGMVGMASMRATGDTRLPSMLMVIAAIINIILDPILIFGLGPIPRMELNGAALAALLARSGIFVGTLYIMRKRLDMLTFNKPNTDELRNSWVDILHVGIPAAATNAIIPVATGVITAMLARYGPEAVAGFGVASRVESLMLVIFYALSAIIGPFVGQNVAASKRERIYTALRLCSGFCLASGLAIAIGLAFANELIASLFSQNSTVTGVAELYMWIVPVSYGAYGMVMVMNASFNGMGKPMPAVAISVGRMAVLYVPLAMLGQFLWGIHGIFAAYAVANVITGVIAYVWARASVQEQCDRHGPPVLVTETG